MAELWSIYDFLMPQYLFNYNQFKKRYENDIVKKKDKQKTEDLRKLVKPFMLRRNKKDVLTELPEKIETTKIISFNKDERNRYLSKLAQANEDLQKLLEIDSSSNKVQILNLMMQLRQICCDSRLVYKDVDNISSKMQATIELIRDLK
ncbi:MAG: SNF2-related protein [Erysipelotrichaceae bacterium]|nr:SNF2-related protein [Erysipelotrichaceae bacterium]